MRSNNCVFKIKLLGQFKGFHTICISHIAKRNEKLVCSEGSSILKRNQTMYNCTTRIFLKASGVIEGVSFLRGLRLQKQQEAGV